MTRYNPFSRRSASSPASTLIVAVISTLLLGPEPALGLGLGLGPGSAALPPSHLRLSSPSHHPPRAGWIASPGRGGRTGRSAYGPPRPSPDRRPPAAAAVVSALSNVPFFAVEADGEEEEEAEAENPGASVAASASAAVPSLYSVVECDGTPPSIERAASFMVGAFWLESPQGLLVGDGGGEGAEDAAIALPPDPSSRSDLARRQGEDLTEKYGERMGRRLLDSALLLAAAPGGGGVGGGGAVASDADIAGLVGIEARLLNSSTGEILGSDESESILKSAVASLGPKQRRLYKDSPASELSAELLPPDLQLICVLSNLCVSSDSRRTGLGGTLCTAAEDTGKEWGFDEMYLRVEVENGAARALYEGRMGYEIRFGEARSMVGLRVDTEGGDFVEIRTDTLTMAKRL